LKKYASILIVLGLLVLSACGEDTIILPGDELRDQIRVVGAATITKSPDIAIAQIGVQTFNKEVKPAVDENNKKTDAVIASLRGNGVEEKDIKTTSFNVYPEIDYEKDRSGEIVGYRVNNTVLVTLRDLESIGKTLQAAIESGANNVSGISFALEDPEPASQEARTKAIENARQRAETMAEAAEVKLGKVVSINELSYSVPGVSRGGYYEDAEFAAEVPIEPGELELSVQIEVVFAIE